MTRLAPDAMRVLRSTIAAANERYVNAGMPELQMRVNANGSVTYGHAKSRASSTTGVAAATDTTAASRAQQPASSDGAAAAPADANAHASANASAQQPSTSGAARSAAGDSQSANSAADAPSAGVAPAPAESARQDAARTGATAAGSAPASDAAITRRGASPTVTQMAAMSAGAFRLSWPRVAGAVRYGIWQNGVLIGTVAASRFDGLIAPNGASVIQVDAIDAHGVHSALSTPLRLERSGARPFVARRVAAATASSADAQQGASLTAG